MSAALRSRGVLWLAMLLVPPAGLVLLWLRPGWRIGSILGKLGGTLLCAMLTLGYLFLFGMRVELSGYGVPGFFTFQKPEAHFEQLEKNRAAQKAEEPKSQSVEESKGATVGSGVAASASAPATPGADKPARAAFPAPYWTAFRGAKRDAVYDEMPILTTWPREGLKPLWRQPIGGGYASFSVADGRAFTIEQRRGNEVVAAYDIETGRELWTVSWPAHFQEPMGGPGPRATPTWDGGRVYALGATGEFRCIEAATGKVLWSKNILSENGAANLNWAMAASPLVVDDKVIVQPGGRSGKSVVAYSKLTGQVIWSALDDTQAYTSPMVVHLAGRRQILTVSGERAMGLAAEDGALLWDYPWTTQYGVNAAQPIVVDQTHVFLSAGYGHGSELLEVTPSGSAFQVRTVWQNVYMKNRFNGSVLHQGYIYGIDEGILTCLDARTGERKWKGGRYGFGQVLLASGHVIVLTETGDLVLVRATPQRHEELASFSALEGKTWNVPALAGGLLLVRNTTEMAAFRIGAP